MVAARPTLIALPSLDDLYAAAPEEFVAARNALAKQLKAAGDKETAAEIAQLRRPPVSAWALNQVARQQPDEIGSLLAAAAELSDALADPAGADLRAVQRAFRGAIETTVRATLDLVSASGRNPSPGLQQAIQATLQAAAVDEGIALALRSGVLAEDEPAPGFLFVESDGAPAAEPTAKAAKAAEPATPTKKAAIGGRRRTTAPTPEPTSADTEADRVAARAAARAAERAAAKEQARLEAEEREAERRRRVRLAELRTDAKRLEKRADRLEAAAIQAEAAAESARTEADEARSEADAVLRALEAAESA